MESAIDRIMEKIPKSERSDLRAKIKESFAMYEDNSLGSHVSGDIETFGGVRLPEWFISRFREGNFPKWFLDVALNRVFFTSSQVEDKASLSSHLVAEIALKEILRLILSLDTDSNQCVKFVHRQRSGITKTKFDFESCEGATLAELRSLNQEEKLSHVLKVLNLPENLKKQLQDLNFSFQIVALSVFCWTSKTQITDFDIKVLSFWFTIQWIQGLLKVTLEETDFSDKMTAFKAKIARFYATDRDIKAGTSKSNLDFIHRLSNFQAFLYYISKLFDLIGLECDFDICQVYHGTFLFNIYNDFQAYRDVEREKALLNFDGSLIEGFEKVLGVLNAFSVNLSEAKLRGKKHRRKKNKIKESQINLQDLENKFSLLATDE